MSFHGLGLRAASASCAAGHTFMTITWSWAGRIPAYVREDVNLQHAIENVADGAFFNSGQCCCGIERVYVHENVYDRFVEGFVDLTKQYVLGDPLDRQRRLGRWRTAPRRTVRDHIATRCQGRPRADRDQDIRATTSTARPIWRRRCWSMSTMR